MLDFIFGFNARLGRLQYFLSTIVLFVLFIAIAFAIIAGGGIHVPKGSHLTWDMLSWPVACVVLLFTGATFMLQAMRLRDIGWDPVCVLGGWIAIVVIVGIVAPKVPVLWLVSWLVNLVMYGVLYFWPSGDA